MFPPNGRTSRAKNLRARGVKTRDVEGKFVRRHLLWNVVIGLGLFVLLRAPFIQHNFAVAGARSAVIDWQMDRLSGLEPTQRLAWIDVSSAAHTAWGVPYVTPRDRIEQLIAFAARGHAAVIVVDFDLTNGEPGLTKQDRALAQFLKAYPRTCARPCASVLLARKMGLSAYWYAGRNTQALQAEPSFLDGTLGTSPSRPWHDGLIQWGTVAIDHDPDFVERKWRPWENSCAAEGRAKVTPSIVLLASAAASGTPYSDVQGALEPHALECATSSSAEAAWSGADNPTGLRLGTFSLLLAEDDLARRIFYRIPYAPRSNDLIRLSAAVITRDQQSDASILNGKVVIIGSSDPQSRDMHPTPIGEMPGTLVLINAINSLLSVGSPREPSLWAGLAIELFLIALVSVLFAYLPPWWALAVAVGTITLGTLTVGFVAFNSGIWVDSVIPLLAVALHQFAEHLHRHAGRVLARPARSKH